MSLAHLLRNVAAFLTPSSGLMCAATYMYMEHTLALKRPQESCNINERLRQMSNYYCTIVHQNFDYEKHHAGRVAVWS